MSAIGFMLIRRAGRTPDRVKYRPAERRLPWDVGFRRPREGSLSL